jgi:hypothetical protein
MGLHEDLYPKTTTRLRSRWGAPYAGPRIASTVDDADAALLQKTPLLGGSLAVLGLDSGSVRTLNVNAIQEAKARDAKQAELEANAKKLAGISGWDFVRIAWLKSLLVPLQKAKFFDNPAVLEELANTTNASEIAKLGDSLARGINSASSIASVIPGVGAIGGAVAGATIGFIEWIVGALERATERNKQFLLGRLLLVKMIEWCGPPPSSLVLQVGYRGGNFFQRIATLYTIAAKYYREKPEAWLAVPAYDKAGMQAFADLLTTPLRQSIGYTPLWAPGLVRTTRNTDALDVQGADLRTYSISEDRTVLSWKAQSDFFFYYALDAWYPQLAKSSWAEKGYFTPGELAAFRMDANSGVTNTPSTTANDTGAWIFKNVYYGRYDGREGLVTFMPELLAYATVAINMNKDSGLLYGPTEVLTK